MITVPFDFIAGIILLVFSYAADIASLYNKLITKNEAARALFGLLEIILVIGAYYYLVVKLGIWFVAKPAPSKQSVLLIAWVIVLGRVIYDMIGYDLVVSLDKRLGK